MIYVTGVDATGLHPFIREREPPVEWPYSSAPSLVLAGFSADIPNSLSQSLGPYRKPSKTLAAVPGKVWEFQLWNDEERIFLTRHTNTGQKLGAKTLFLVPKADSRRRFILNGRRTEIAALESRSLERKVRLAHSWSNPEGPLQSEVL